MTIREWLKSIVLKINGMVRRWFRVYPYKIGDVQYLAPGHTAIGKGSPPRICNFNWTPRPLKQTGGKSRSRKSLGRPRSRK